MFCLLRGRHSHPEATIILPSRASVRWGSCVLAVIILLLGLAFQGAAKASERPINLAALSHEVDLVTLLEVREGGEHSDLTPQQQLATSGWQRAGNARGLLRKPRERSTIWLRGLLENTSKESLKRWLKLNPRRLNQVKAWFLNPNGQRVLAQARAGAGLPVDQRTVESNHTLLPVTLVPGESQQLLIKITSDSRPYLTLQSWDPVTFSVAETKRFQTYMILLAIILTLLGVLLLQMNTKHALIGIWMLLTFAFESEKQGYVSTVLFSGLADYSLNIRVTLWVLSLAVFLIISVYLLGLQRHRYGRGVMPAVLVTTAIYSALTFVLSAPDARNLLLIISFAFLFAWLFLIPAALGQGDRWQWGLLLLLFVWWTQTLFRLLSYTFNFSYTSLFETSNIILEIGVILGLLSLYSLQNIARERQLKGQLEQQQKNQRERLEEELAAQTLELRQAVDEADKANAAKTDFLARITHDLRSPLTSVLGYTQLLGAEPGRAGEMSRTAHASAKHMLNLVNRLISYARGTGEGEVRLSDLYLSAFLDSIAEEAKVICQHNGNTFSLLKASNLPPVVRCDETYLRQILTNLLDNAAKYTTQGQVELQVSCNAPSDRNQLTLVFSVIDNGCGIDPEQRAQLWDPFYQSSRQREGLGLGLAIVQTLTRQLGGELALESERGQGTEVRLTLPVTPGREDSATLAITQMPHHLLPRFDASGLTAWVVEDSSAIRDFLGAELDGLGFVVRSFADAEAFIVAADSAPTAPDMVMTDYHLPAASGDAVLAASRRRWPRVPVILLSATQTTLAAASQQNDYRYSACLTKPVDLVTLRRTLADTCQRQLDLQSSPQPVAEPAGFKEAAVVLDQQERRQLARFLALGAVTDLLEWCQALAEQDPERRALAARLAHLAENGHFDTIEDLLGTH